MRARHIAFIRLIRRYAIQCSPRHKRPIIAGEIMNFTELTKHVSFKYRVISLLGALFLIICFSNPIFSAENSFFYDLFSATFPTQSHGWACGRLGAIIHTSTGGQEWHLQKSGIPYTLSSIAFADTQNGWAVGDNGSIIHTADGGKTWEKQKSPISSYLMGVVFTDNKRGWIVGERTTILHTEDGGKSWNIQFQDEDYILKSVSFCDAHNGWAAGEYGYIYHTSDNGKTWHKQAGHFGFSEETGDVEAGAYIFDILAISPLECWGVGIDGYITKTLDGGNTWVKVKQNIPKTHLFSITQDRQGNIIIGGNGLLLMRSNNESAFRRLESNPPITYGWIYGLEPLKQDGFIAVGKRGWIYSGNDQGALKQTKIIN